MGAPSIKRFTRAAPTALSTFALMTDDDTGLTYIQITKPNKILDVTNDPDTTSTERFMIKIEKGGVDTGRRLYTDSMKAGSAGRMAVGPIDVTPGQLFFRCAQYGTVAGVEAYSMIIKFAAPP